MDRPSSDRRHLKPVTSRKTFGELATHAIRKRVRESSSYGAHWLAVPNLAWVRWPREDGRCIYCSVRRRHDWITGELGASPVPADLDDLPLLTTLEHMTEAGGRIQLGPLLTGHDRWWSSGGSEASLIARIDWIALQLQLRLHSIATCAFKRPA